MADLFAEVVSWLDPASWSSPPFSGRSLAPDRWSRIKSILVRQGISSYLADRLPGTRFHNGLPTEIQRWLEAECASNKQRIQAMHTDLGLILAAACKAGVTVMPMKGSLLTLSYYPVPYWRPMADLDLLVHPNDLELMTSILLSLRYRKVSQISVYARHAVFAHPRYEQVVNWEGEHPDNPRPVEVHTRIQRPFWGNIESPDLTNSLWDTASSTLLLGSPAFVPSDQALLAHLCIHTLQDMLTQKARLVQLLDLAFATPPTIDLDQLPSPRYLYPPICLAHRLFPEILEEKSLHSMAMRIPRSLQLFFQSVPIDNRCGLAGTTPQIQHSRLRLHWDRWKPLIWRMQLIYGDIPYPLAFLRHAAAAARHLREMHNRPR